jgi:hypothetical protein
MYTPKDHPTAPNTTQKILELTKTPPANKTYTGLPPSQPNQALPPKEAAQKEKRQQALNTTPTSSIKRHQNEGREQRKGREKGERRKRERVGLLFSNGCNF